MGCWDTEQVWRTPADLARLTTPWSTPSSGLLCEVSTAYRTDRGRSLVQAAFVGTTTESPS